MCCCCSVARLCLTLCDPMDYSMPGSSVLHYLLEFAQSIVSVMLSNHHVICLSSPFAFNLSQHNLPLFSFCIQSFPASVFSKELDLHIRWSNYWSFSFNISLSNEYSGLTSFRIDWFNLFAGQGAL